jgi:hypothetical protein
MASGVLNQRPEVNASEAYHSGSILSVSAAMIRTWVNAHVPEVALLMRGPPGIDDCAGSKLSSFINEKKRREAVGIEAITARMKTITARLAARLGRQGGRRAPASRDPGGRWQAGGRQAGAAGRPAGQPSRLRSFDPVRIADLEYRAWVGYYLRNWPQVLVVSVGLVKAGFGMDWYRTLHGAWLVLRANQLWAPFPDNDPDGARACMRRFYALVRLSYGEPASPAEAAALEVDWWRVHREDQYSTAPRGPGDQLVESVTRLYCYLYGEPGAEVRPAAVHRARAMDLSDQWVAEGCLPDSPLLPLEHAALVRGYAALLAAVHH